MDHHYKTVWIYNVLVDERTGLMNEKLHERLRRNDLMDTTATLRDIWGYLLEIYPPKSKLDLYIKKLYNTRYIKGKTMHEHIHYFTDIWKKVEEEYVLHANFHAKHKGRAYSKPDNYKIYTIFKNSVIVIKGMEEWLDEAECKRNIEQWEDVNYIVTLDDIHGIFKSVYHIETRHFRHQKLKRGDHIDRDKLDQWETSFVLPFKSNATIQNKQKKAFKYSKSNYSKSTPNSYRKQKSQYKDSYKRQQISGENRGCFGCKGSHNLKDCNRTSLTEKKRLANQYNLCNNCFGGGHKKAQCKKQKIVRSYSMKAKTVKLKTKDTSNCHKCGKKGHFAKECTSTGRPAILNGKRSAIDTLKMCSYESSQRKMP